MMSAMKQDAYDEMARADGAGCAAPIDDNMNGGENMMQQNNGSGALGAEAEIEVGFEEMDAHGFGNYSQMKQQNNLRDMFKV